MYNCEVSYKEREKKIAEIERKQESDRKLAASFETAEIFLTQSYLCKYY